MDLFERGSGKYRRVSLQYIKIIYIILLALRYQCYSDKEVMTIWRNIEKFRGGLDPDPASSP